MSTRWMAVQYVGNTLRLPVVNESDMDMPFGGSILEREVDRIVVNPFSERPQVFVPESECDELRKELDQWNRLVANIELPEYPISQFQPKDLERENAKLRELVRELWEGYMDPPCEDCPLKDKPACADCPICLREAAVIDRMRKLGVEVDG